MDVEESPGGPGGELIAPKGHKRQERKLLALALGVKLRSRGTLLWKPIKLLASCPQISSPAVRRRTLRDSPEKTGPYTKGHSFKVTLTLSLILLSRDASEGSPPDLGV